MTAISNNICHIERHDTSNKHVTEKTALKKQPLITSRDVDKFESKIRKVKTAELKIIIFLIMNNLTFTLITSLIELIKVVATDSQIVKELQCGKTKATETTNSLLYTSFLEKTVEILKKQPFSIIIDETTDISSRKCLALVVRYFKVKYSFFCMLELAASDAQTIFQSLLNFFNENQIPLKNLIVFAADTAAVMMGHIKGVQYK